jgi:5-methylcytosine-specific restriction protein A
MANEKDQTLHEKAVEVATRYRLCEAELLDVICQLDEAKTFLNHGYTSLYGYCIGALKLPEGTTYNLISVARKSKSIPELKMAIAAGDLSISKANKITSVITPENKDHWIEMAKTSPRVQLEKEVAKISPQAATPEKAKYVSEKRISLQLGVSEEHHKNIKRIQDFESKRLRRNISMEETLELCVLFYLQKKDPINKAKKALIKQNSPELFPGRVAFSFERVPVPAKLKHQVVLRDNGQCQKCSDKRFTEIHHVIPVARGGTNDIANLKTLCAAHHKMEHPH